MPLKEFQVSVCNLSNENVLLSVENEEQLSSSISCHFLKNFTRLSPTYPILHTFYIFLFSFGHIILTILSILFAFLRVTKKNY